MKKKRLPSWPWEKHELHFKWWRNCYKWCPLTGKLPYDYDASFFKAYEIIKEARKRWGGDEGWNFDKFGYYSTIYKPYPVRELQTARDIFEFFTIGKRSKIYKEWVSRQNNNKTEDILIANSVSLWCSQKYKVDPDLITALRIISVAWDIIVKIIEGKRSDDCWIRDTLEKAERQLLFICKIKEEERKQRKRTSTKLAQSKRIDDVQDRHKQILAIAELIRERNPSLSTRSLARGVRNKMMANNDELDKVPKEGTIYKILLKKLQKKS